MIYCSGCGKQLSEGIKVCEACGTTAPYECPQCGTKITAGTAFCFNCGLAMIPSQNNPAVTEATPVFAYAPAESSTPEFAYAPAETSTAETYPVFEIPEQSAGYQPSSSSAEQAYTALQGTDYLSSMLSAGALSAETSSPAVKKASKKFNFGKSKPVAAPEPEYRQEEPSPAFPVQLHPAQTTVPQTVSQTAEEAYLATKASSYMDAASSGEKPLSAETVAPVKVKAADGYNGGKAVKKRRVPLKAVMIAAAALVLAVSVAFGSMLIFGKTEELSYGIFQKDGEIWLTMLDGTPAVQVTSGSTSRYVSGAFTVLSKDGKKLFYANRYSVADGISIATLYCRDLNAGTDAEFMIDTDVQSGYIVSETGDRVTYIKGIDNTLYQHDMSASIKLASNVKSFYASEDGKRVAYLTVGKDLYVTDIGVQTRQIASNVTSLSYLDEELSVFVYIKGTVLYRHELGDEAEEIAKDVHSVAKAYSEDSFYFYRKSEYVKYIMDFVNDDMEIFDSNLGDTTEPVPPDPNDYDSTEEFEQAYDYYTDAIVEYYSNYWDLMGKSERDAMRLELSTEVLFTHKLSLCYFDGGSVGQVSDSVGFLMTGGAAGTLDYIGDGINCAADVPAVAFCKYDEADIKKVALSGIENTGSLRSEIANSLSGGGECGIAAEDTVTMLDKKSAEFYFTADGSKVYYWVGKHTVDTVYGELYSSNISGGKAEKDEKLEEKVSRYGISVVGKDNLIYYKNFIDYEGDLYINGEMIDDDVSILKGVTFCEETGGIYYFTKWDNLYNEGNLKMYGGAGADPLSVAAEVYAIQAMDSGVMYINDYSTSDMLGTLYYHNGKTVTEVEKDVTGFPLFSSYQDRYKRIF